MLGFGRKSEIPKNATFRLTEEGKEKLQNYNGSAQFKVLVALETAQTSCDTEEIARSSGLSRGAVERIIPVLIERGYLSRSGAGVGGMSEGGVGDDEDESPRHQIRRR